MLVCVLFELQDVNNVIVERAFCDIFISSNLLTRHQIGQILAFAIANCDVMCEMPTDVQDLIAVRLGNSTSASLSYSCHVGKLGPVINSVDMATNNCSTLHAESVGKLWYY